MEIINLLYLVGGFIAGFIDAIAGGGGLITLPLMSITLGASAEAIATNKIVGTAGALVALLVYSRKGYPNSKQAFVFVTCIAIGSFLGTKLLLFIPTSYIRWVILLAAPLLLYVVWQKDRWVEIEKREHHHTLKANPWIVATSGLACGIYDGAFGPGGGTFMFLALMFFAKLPLFAALTLSKLANTASAGTSLVSYATKGLVHWKLGFMVATGMCAGAFAGSKLASKKAASIIRPVLTLAVILLLSRIFQQEFSYFWR